MKTGKGLLRLHVVPIGSPFKEGSRIIDLKIVAHHSTHLVGSVEGEASGQSMVLVPCDLEWLNLHCAKVANLLDQSLVEQPTLDVALCRLFGMGRQMESPVVRAEDFKGALRAIPAKNATIQLNRDYDELDSFLISGGFLPASMDDKWLIYRERDHLYLHRSWTGICIYEVSLMAIPGGGLRLVEMRVNHDPDDYDFLTNDAEIEFLYQMIDVVLLCRPF